MPLLYTHIPIYPSGMVSAQPFELPGDGRKVFFEIPGGGFRKEIFILQDGQFNEAAFANGSRLETGVRGLDRLFSMPHEAYAIVVDRAEYGLDPISLPISPIPVTFPEGKHATIKLRGSINAAIYPENPTWLARDYVNGVITSPEATARSILEETAREALTKVIAAAARQVSPQAFVGGVDSLSLELSREVTKAAAQRLPWCGVSRCQVSLSVENVEELLTISNESVVFGMEAKRKMLDILVQHFLNAPSPADTAQTLVAFIGANPGLPTNEVLDFCRGVVNLWNRADHTTFLATATKAGLLPGTKGGSC